MAGTTQYKNNWQKANLDRISLTVPKGRKAQIQEHASAHGESINGFINRAVYETMDWERTFEQTREEIIAVAKEYDVDIDEHEIKKLAAAFAILEPQIPNIKKSYFSRLQPQEQPSDVVVIDRDGPVR